MSENVAAINNYVGFDDYKALNNYDRYRINARVTEDFIPHPPSFIQKINPFELGRHIVEETIKYRGNWQVVKDSPCKYGVFDSPIGGFGLLIPRYRDKYQEKCVGCLRCTTQHPRVVQILRNTDTAGFGDSYFNKAHYDTVHFESATGRIPVRGAGYRGEFGGEGWDGMWTDMSEIVRPTRDGIHGREYISTVVDIGIRDDFLEFDEGGLPINLSAQNFSLPVPFIFGLLPKSASSEKVTRAIVAAAGEIASMSIVPVDQVIKQALFFDYVVPYVKKNQIDLVQKLGYSPKMIELATSNINYFENLQNRFPDTIISLRVPFISNILDLVDAGVNTFHLTANYHGLVNGGFIMDKIMEIHNELIDAGKRESVTLIGSGGIIAAEHLPKALLCGLDAVSLDTTMMVAMQAKFLGEAIDRNTAKFELPKQLTADWAAQRLINLSASWRDQLLEIMGAMGIREVRRLRGEIGRAMFQKDLDKEAFSNIEGYQG